VEAVERRLGVVRVGGSSGLVDLDADPRPGRREHVPVDDPNWVVDHLVPQGTSARMTSWIRKLGVDSAKWMLTAVAIGPSGLCGATET
jgi:hypothetical protein